MKPIHGEREVVSVPKKSDARTIISAGVEQFHNFHQDFPVSSIYTLHYPDGRVVENLPGKSEPFTLCQYKAMLMKDYKRIVFFLYESGKLLHHTYCFLQFVICNI